MTQDGFGAAPPHFSIGGAVAAGLALLRRNFWTFFAIAFVVGIPLLILSLLLALGLAQVYAPQAGASPGEGGRLLLSMLIAFIALLTLFVIQSAVSYGALQDLRGQRPAVGRCISRGLAALPRVFGATLLVFLLMFVLAFLGVLALSLLGAAISVATGAEILQLVPAIAVLGMIALALYCFVGWWVLVPVLVFENAKVFGAFRRSRQLTKGHRWRILAIILLVFLGNALCSLVVGAIGQLGAVATAALLNVAVALAFSALSSVLVAVGYAALRGEKEGFGADDLARIFD